MGLDINNDMNVRICKKCGIIGLDQMDFNIIWVRDHYLYRGKCDSCIRQEMKVRNKQEHRIQQKREWRLKYGKEADRKYYEEHSGRWDVWRRNNLDKKRQLNQAYRARKAVSRGSYTVEDLKHIYKCQNGVCPSCKRAFSFDDLSVDHIIPISWPDSSNWPNNIQLLCRSCNSSKSNHTDKDFRETKPVFFSEIIRKHRPRDTRRHHKRI